MTAPNYRAIVSRNQAAVVGISTAGPMTTAGPQEFNFGAPNGDDNPVAPYIPGTYAHGYEALTDCLFVYHVTEEYEADDPDEHGVAWNDPRVRHLWSTSSPMFS